ncbi:MAG: hypothetical protein M3380_04815 [Chloroflexota bacterium]|nr:hypothetical protein [Chloroflexota bacterium]
MMKPLSLAIATGLALDVSGALHVYGLADARGGTREFITASILLVLAGFWLMARPARRAPADVRVPLWVAFLPAVAGVLSISDILTFVSRDWTPVRFAVFGVGTVALLLLALRRAPAAYVAMVALALGTALRIIHMRHVPLEPARGDMLPLVQGALANLMEGRSPYTTYFMPWELPLTYLPLTWLAYAPAYLLRIDLRWTNIVAEVAVLGAAFFVARHAHGGYRRSAVDTTFLLWAWLFLSPTVIHWDMITSAPIGWAAIAWTLALVATARPRAASIALGLSAATTPLIIVFGPLIGLCWWRGGGLRDALGKGALAVVLASIVLLPWIIWAPGPFWEGNVGWFNDLDRFPRMKWETEHTWAEMVGFSGFFWSYGQERWLKPVQFALVSLAAALYMARGASRADLHHYAAGIFLLFMLFNPVLWPYLYNPALVAALLAVAGAGATNGSAPRRHGDTEQETVSRIAPMLTWPDRRARAEHHRLVDS